MSLGRVLNLASKPRAAGEVYKNKSAPETGIGAFPVNASRGGERKVEGGRGRPSVGGVVEGCGMLGSGGYKDC